MTRILLLLLALSLGSVAGCKKQRQAKETPPPAAGDAPTPESPAAASSLPATPSKATEKLQGASVVRDDLKNKNYAKAVEGLLVLRGFAVNDEQKIEHRELTSEVVQALAAAAPTDPNAAKARAALNATLYGR